MSWNPYKRLAALLEPGPIEVGLILAVYADGVTVQLAEGSQIRVRGEGTIGTWVYVRDGAVEGPAPALTGITIEV